MTEYETDMDTNTTSSQLSLDGALAAVQQTIEAVLFAAGHPISYAKLAEVTGETPAAVRRIAEEYAAQYNSDSSPLPRGVMMLTFEDSCQLCTKEQFGTQIREALGIRRGGNLSASSLEVLAIVAYNEPVTRAYIDTVRGVDSSYGVSSLCEKRLIEPCGRLDVPGRPLLYRTTPDFLRVFGMQSLAELPPVDLPAKPSAEDAAVLSDGSEAPASVSD